MIQPSQPPLRAKGKQANRAYGAREMHPFWCFAPLPPEGEVLAALCLEILMGEMIPAGCCPTVHILHRMCKLGGIRRLACPLRRFLFVAQPNRGGKVVPQAPKGGKPPKVANHRNAVHIV